MKELRIGSGAGYAGDRLEPAIELMENGNLDYICFECLAERTIAIAQQAKLKDPSKGYNGLLEYRMEKVLPLAYEKGIKVITNMGAANPERALEVVRKMAADMNLKGLKIAAVLGDDIFNSLENFSDEIVWETGNKLKEMKGEVVSANAYLGIEGIVKALEEGADIVITGRVSDPALFLAPMVYEFGWSLDDYEKLGKGTAVGHLLECAGQVTGGYFCDPGKKDVVNPWSIPFPLAVINELGDAVITKAEGTGGIVNTATVTEQLLYEIHDPASYITPDCVADFSAISLEEVAPNQVKVTGASGRENTSTLKVSLGYKDCFIGEGEISYGGPGCLERAQLAAEIVSKRLDQMNLQYDETRVDLIGVDSIYKNSSKTYTANPNEVRMRYSGRTDIKADAVKLGNEVETLYTNGPAGGGGVTKSVKEIISVASILIPRTAVSVTTICKEVQ